MPFLIAHYKEYGGIEDLPEAVTDHNEFKLKRELYARL